MGMNAHCSAGKNMVKFHGKNMQVTSIPMW